MKKCNLHVVVQKIMCIFVPPQHSTIGVRALILTDKENDMEVIKTGIEGVYIIEPRLFKDARGYFFESFSQREFEEKVGSIQFVQDNESMSSYGVMRGLHCQRPPDAQS